MEITLPEKPVDGYVIRFFSIYQLDRVKECRMVYHANTPWRVYCPDDPERGADLIDDWMHYDDPNGHCQGRSEGWLTPMKLSWDGCFETYEEARDALVARLTKTAEYRESEAARLRRQISELTTTTPHERPRP